MFKKILKAGNKIASYVLSDKAYVKINYRLTMHKHLNLKNPVLFSEKLQWIKLYDHNPMYTTMVDKKAVKNYVAERIGSEYVVPMYGSWNNPDEINFNELPDKFVLKVTHDSGGLVLCRDKSQLDVEEAKIRLSKALKNNYFRYSREWPYKNIKPQIIAEKFLENADDGTLPDFKVLCFNGVPKLIELHKGRFTENHTQDIYDTAWNLTDISQVSMPTSGEKSPKPVFLDKMLELSEILSKDIPHVRVDWYYSDNRLYFGELTFFDTSGFIVFENDGDDEKLGKWLQLPEARTVRPF